MLKPDRFSCSQKIRLKRDPPVYTQMPYGSGLDGYMFMITLVTLLYTQLTDIYLLYRINGFNYQLLYATLGIE